VTRIRKVSQMLPQKGRSTPRNTPRSPRRQRKREPGSSFTSRLLRFGVVMVVGSLALGVWNLRVEAVALRGLCLTEQEAAKGVVASLLGQRWIGADTGGVAKALSGQGWIEGVGVRRKLFGRIEVSVREHQALFVCAEDPTQVVTCCASLADAPPGLDLSSLPTISGAQAIASDTARRAAISEVLAALSSPRWPFVRAVTKVELEGHGGIEFVLEDGTEIWMGRRGLEQRLQWLAADPESWRRSDASRIDLRFDRQVVLASDQVVRKGS
jgi:cell division septal protein FtsQ